MNNNACRGSDPVIAGALGRGACKCDSYSIVAGATRLVAGSSGAAPDGGVRFPGEFSITASTFAPGQVLNFGSLAYIADRYSELRLLKEAPPA